MPGRVAKLVVCLLASAISAVGQAGTADRESAIKEAVFAKGRLWIVSDMRFLSSIAEGAAARVRVDLPGRVVRICSGDGEARILTYDTERRWLVRRLDEAGWVEAASVSISDDDHIEAMVCDATTTVVVTGVRLITLAQGRETSVLLSGRLHKGGVRASLGTDAAIFIGRYAGEWGGGLDRIDRRSGQVTSIEGTIPAQYCRKPIDSACDPVNGIATEPWTPGCVVAAIGLEHMSPGGSLVEVCGETAVSIFRKPYGSIAPYSSMPFYGIVRVGETLRAIGPDGLYEIDRSGGKQMGPLPAFRDVDGVAVSFAVPGLVVLLRDIGPHPPSARGGPMLVAR